MQKFTKRYVNGKKGSPSLIIRMEVNKKNYYIQVVPFFPHCQNGGESEITAELSKRGWRETESTKVTHIWRRTFRQNFSETAKIVNAVIFLDAFWDVGSFWTEKAGKEIPLSVKHFIFLVEKLVLAKSDNASMPRDEIEMLKFLEDRGFKQAACHSQRRP